MKKMLFAMTVAMAAAFALRAETVTAAGRMDLGGVWHLREADNAVQFTVPIQVPGDVHSALLAAGKIPDPFFGQNELLTQQVNDLRETNATLTQQLETLRKQLAALSKGKDG